MLLMSAARRVQTKDPAELIRKMVEHLHRVFDEDDAMRVKNKLDSYNGFVTISNYKEVLTEFFEDPEKEQPQTILSTPILLERMFKFMDANKDGKIDFIQFCGGATRLFSGDDSDQATVHVALYDPDNKGTISREDIIALVRPVVSAMMKNAAADLESDQQKERFARAQAQAEGERGAAVLADILSKAFKQAGVPDGAALTHAQFLTAYAANPDSFHFRELAHDVMEFVEEEVQRK